METPSEENREQRQDKRGTNELSQRAGSLLSPLCLLVGGEMGEASALTYFSQLALNLHNRTVAAQQGCLSKALSPSLNVCMSVKKKKKKSNILQVVNISVKSLFWPDLISLSVVHWLVLAEVTRAAGGMLHHRRASSCQCHF